MKVADFSMDLRRTLTPPGHVFATSGFCSVQPLVHTVTGVGELFSPPVAARGLRLLTSLLVDGKEIGDTGSTGKGDVGILFAGGVWHLDGVVRRGTYHHRQAAGRLLSFSVESRLTPLVDAAGFVLRLNVRNRGAGIRRLSWRAHLEPGTPALCALDDWDFRPPEAGLPARRIGARHWRNSVVSIRIIQDDCAGPLDSGAARTLWLGVIIQPAEDGDSRLPAPGELPGAEKATRSRWRRLLARTAANFPSLHTDIPGLGEYYRRSLASALVCLWDHPGFALRPWVATGGLDGGAVCAYPWDNAGYASGAMTLLLAGHCREHLRRLAGYGLDRHSRMAPSGRGRETYYAYSLWALVALLDASARLQGPPDVSLVETVASLLDAAENAHPARGDLLDYGTQSNLLEMRATGWEHVVASPNAERAWCHEVLAGLLEGLGDRARAARLRRKAAAIRRAIRMELWDRSAGWFLCLHPEGHSECVYSIQAYDALRFGACTPAMAARLISRVRPGAFLGDYGVSSVSAEDTVHYECNDPDWSGGGAYSGDGPILALTLWQARRPRLAWDVLCRFFWTGRHLLYHPQEHYCDRPAVVPHKRANIVSGLSGVEAVLFGLAGLRPRADGTLRVAPALPVNGEVEIENFVVRGRRVDVRFDKKHYGIHVDGKERLGGVVDAFPDDKVGGEREACAKKKR